MKIEVQRHKYVVILKFKGAFNTFNLPAFSERIDRMIDGGDKLMVFDLRLLEFINSAALGYLIKTYQRLEAEGGELVLARPGKFLMKTLSTLGLDDVFRMFEGVESAVAYFLNCDDVGEITLAGDEAFTGSVPILFRPTGSAEVEAMPNEVGRIVTLYPDGLLLRYEPADGAGEKDPVESYLKAGQRMALKFRQPFAVEEHYFEINSEIVEVYQMSGGDDDTVVVAARVRFDDLEEEDHKHFQQFVRDARPWKGERDPGDDDAPGAAGVFARLKPKPPQDSGHAVPEPDPESTPPAP